MADSQVQVTFRRLTDDDLPLLHGWLNEPGIMRWWEGDDVSWDNVVKEYGSTSTDPTEYWIASVDGRDIGWIQCYAWADYPDETEQYFALGMSRTAAGIDYLIGDPADRGGKGTGTAMITAFVRDVVFANHPSWDQVSAAPNVDNPASWRALEKAGFREIGIIQDKDGPGRLMVLDRVACG